MALSRRLPPSNTQGDSSHLYSGAVGSEFSVSKAPACPMSSSHPRAACTPGQSLEAVPTDALTARFPLQSGSRLALDPTCSEQHRSALLPFISSLLQRWKSFYLPFAPLRYFIRKKKNCWTHTHVHTHTNENNWGNKNVMGRLYQFPDFGLTHLLVT